MPPQSAWNPLHLWHLASLDAPTVAVVWSLALAWAIPTHLPAWAPVLLALVAWAVYVGDRILDARAGHRTPPQHHLRERHYFHWRHRRILAVCAALAAVAAVWIVLVLLPARALKPDSLVAVATLAYFSGVHARRPLPIWFTQISAPFFSREFIVGALFTAACALPVWSQIATQPHPPVLLLPILFLAALAWLNCRAIGSWENLQTASAIAPTAVLIGLSGLVLASIVHQPRLAALLASCALSALLLAILDHVRPRLSPITLRAAADLVLLTPALLLPFAGIPK